jgi:hypothetical protein
MNADTIVDALRQAGIATETPITLSNPGGNNPWLFTYPAGFAANAGAPVTLNVPCVIGEAIDASGNLAGTADPNGLFYADGNMFIVRAIGRVAPATFAKTLKLYLFAGNGLDAAGGAGGSLGEKQIGFASATLPLQASNDANTNFWMEAKCLWDLQSLTLNGVFTAQIGTNVTTATGFSIYNPSAWAAQQAPGSYNPLPFVVGANVNSTASGVADSVQLLEFVADRL